jgi:cyclic pyranopterin phosphate synthase
MKNYLINYIRNGDRPIIKKTKKALHSIEKGRVKVKHALAQKFPRIIKADIETISIALTSKCNLRCKGCSYGRDFMPLEHVSLEKVKEVLESMRVMNIQYVWFYGGEPSMIKSADLIEMVRYATELGLTSTLGTNGVMLDEKLIGSLYDVGLRRIAIGLYGVEEDYNAYVDREDVFSQLERNLKHIKSTYPAVSVTMGWLFMKPTCNLKSVQEMTAFSKRHNLSFNINLVHYDFPYFVTDTEKSSLLLDEDDLDEIKLVQEELIAFKRSHPELLLNSLTGINSISDWLIKKEKIDIPCYRYDYIWIAANGDVQVCQKAALLGNIYDHSLEEIIYTDEHTQSARDCFALNCTGCNVDWDDRTTSTPQSRKIYSLA